MIEKIESLRTTKTPNEIETVLLSGQLGEIRIGSSGYQYIENLALSHLVVEIHNPGFIKWMLEHPNEYVVHHLDGNILNNVYLNLQVMNRSNHASMHDIVCYADPANAEAVDDRNKAISKTRRKSWIDLSVFKKLFTVKEYAEVSEIRPGIAHYRLAALLAENQLTCEKAWIGSRHNVYRKAGIC